MQMRSVYRLRPPQKNGVLHTMTTISNVFGIGGNSTTVMRDMRKESLCGTDKSGLRPNTLSSTVPPDPRMGKGMVATKALRNDKVVEET